MNTLAKLSSVLAIACFSLVMVACQSGPKSAGGPACCATENCCAAAAKAGKTCEAKCCVDAAKAGTACKMCTKS